MDVSTPKVNQEFSPTKKIVLYFDKNISAAAEEVVCAAEELVRAAEESVRAAEESVCAAEESVCAAEEVVRAAEESVCAAEESVRADRKGFLTPSPSPKERGVDCLVITDDFPAAEIPSLLEKGFRDEAEARPDGAYVFLLLIFYQRYAATRLKKLSELGFV